MWILLSLVKALTGYIAFNIHTSFRLRTYLFFSTLKNFIKLHSPRKTSIKYGSTPPKNMGLALKNMVKSLFDFTPEDFVKN